MWLKSVTLDGFKSYASRTIVGPFDSSFTAITGLNGTGKSNVLDAICFVLGITNLTQVRVHSLSELVYKNGQSGITQASVTLVFDNSDAATSPVGYHACKEISVSRQVIIGGRNRYQINGSTAQLARVVNLFQSVGLNVNNPHFLIMQGRITKVIGMKPVELLSLVEEAAGTRMFESKKQAAQRTMAKKQAKVEEINSILKDEIGPQLNQLKQDQTAYQTWNRKRSQLTNLQRLGTAFQFQTFLKNLDNALNVRKDCEQKIEIESIAVANQTEKIESIEAELQASTSRAQENNQLNQQQAKLESELTETSRNVVKATSTHSNVQSTIESEKSELAKLEKQLLPIKKKRDVKANEYDAAVSAFNASKTTIQTLQDSLDRCQSAELGISTQGSESSNNGGGGLHGQLMQFQQKRSHLESQLKHCSSELLEFERRSNQLQQLQSNKGELKAHKARIAQQNELKQEIERLQISLSAMTNVVDGKAEMERALNAVSDKLTALQSQIAPLAARVKRFEVDYVDPSPSFNRSQVKGRIATLVSVKRPETEVAIEIVGGSKLNHVVVDNERVGAELLNRGQLKQRITLIPLNKIHSNPIDARTLSKAVDLVGADSVDLALNCIEFDQQIKPAAQFVFGSTLVAKNMATATKLGFEPSVAKRTVTYDGDVVDPKGSMEGGSMAQASVLATLRQYNSVKQQIEQHQNERDRLTQSLKTLSKSDDEKRSGEARIVELQHDLALLTVQIQSSSLAMSENDLATLQGQMTTARSKIEELRQQKVACEEEIKRIEALLSDRSSASTTLQSELKSLTKKLADARKNQTKLDDTRRRCENELASLDDEIASIESAIHTCQTTLAEAQRELVLAAESVTREKQTYDHIQKQLGDLQSERMKSNAQHQHLTKQKAAAVKKLKELELELKKLRHSAQKAQEESTESLINSQKLSKANSWIETDKHLFGQPGSDYDFGAYSSPGALSQAINSLSSEVETLGRSINKKVLGMYDACANDYEELQKKKFIIESDKAKIEQVITQLEIKKKIAVKETWKKVNADFGAILSSILPGMFAALNPVDPEHVDQGIEMKVSFNGQWKNSLSELSGGQRSLLALSFILALLLFKPAPMYILDEIDAALDLNHTQNIGTMLRTHFPHSQFIIVSLKEGMFQNANVIFRTQFINGISGVIRSTNDPTMHKAAHESKKISSTAANASRSRKENVSNN